MATKGKQPFRKALLGLLALLVLIALLWLGAFLAGVLPGGGRREDRARAAQGSRATTLRVTVLSGSDRSPVVGARILVSGLAGGQTSAISDVEGRATLPSPGRGPVRVQADFQGLSATVWTDPRRDRELRLAIVPARVRRGRVRDGDGRPVPAVVRLMGTRGRTLAVARTDERGRYELADLDAAVSLSVQPQRGAPAVAIDGDIEVGQGVLRTGRLLGAGPGVLEVYGLMQAPDDDALLAFRSDWPVDRRGRFAGRLPKGVRAFGVFHGLPVRIDQGDLRLPAKATVRGFVTRADGTPAAGASLLFLPLLDADFPLPLPGLRITADGSGEFFAPGFAQVRYAVETRAAGCATRIIGAVRAGQAPIRIRLERGYGVRGRVVDAEGLPVPGARIRAVGWPDETGSRPVARGRADERGRFELAGLGGESARIQVRAAGYAPTSLEGVRGAKPIRVTLRRR